MWWVPLLTALAVALLVALAHWLQSLRAVDGTRVYRMRYVQLVSQLDSITASANHLAQHLDKVKDPKILDYYEQSLKILETLLAAVRKIPPFGKQPHDLGPAFYLSKDAKERIIKAQRAFKAYMRGKPVDVEALLGMKAKATGCYFCSRPVIESKFSEVKVKLDGAVKKVTSCSICREELEKTKKVKVLYFMKSGQPVHWSQVDEYKPSEDYWNINRHKPVRTTRHLELIHSSPVKKAVKGPKGKKKE